MSTPGTARSDDVSGGGVTAFACRQGTGVRLPGTAGHGRGPSHRAVPESQEERRATVSNPLYDPTTRSPSGHAGTRMVIRKGELGILCEADQLSAETVGVASGEATAVHHKSAATAERGR